MAKMHLWVAMDISNNILEHNLEVFKVVFSLQHVQRTLVLNFFLFPFLDLVVAVTTLDDVNYDLGVFKS